MPQLDLKYSADLNLNPTAIFTAMESTIQSLDDSAGICMSRAYPATDYLHQHVYCHVSVLNKAHRDDAFMKRLYENLTHTLATFIPKQCHYAIELEFCSAYYSTLKNTD